MHNVDGWQCYSTSLNFLFAWFHKIDSALVSLFGVFPLAYSVYLAMKGGLKGKQRRRSASRA